MKGEAGWLEKRVVVVNRMCCPVLCVCRAWHSSKLPLSKEVICVGYCLVSMLAGLQAGLVTLSCKACSPGSIMAQQPSWELDCMPSQGQASCCSTPGVAARHGIVSFEFSLCCTHYRSTADHAELHGSQLYTDVLGLAW